MTPRAALNGLATIRRRIEVPGNYFWTPDRLTAWREEAQTAARAVLLLARPTSFLPSAPDAWTETVEALVARIFIARHGDTASISVSSGPLVTTTGKDIYYGGDEFSEDAILDWIEAGRKGDPLGKDIVPSQDNTLRGSNPDRQIAWKIIHAMREGEHPNLRASIEEFHAHNSPGSADAADLVGLNARLAVLQDWHARFAIRGAREWRAYLRKTLRKW